MGRVWHYIMGSMMMGLSASGLPAEDLTLLESVQVDRVRPLVLETVLVSEGAPRARIVSPDSAPWADGSRQVQALIRESTGVELPIVSDREIGDEDWTGGNLVVLGNLLDSQAFARLYHNFFVCADGGYTGTAGYELRSVHEPFGPGGNVIALGAQSASGMRNSIERLRELVQEHGRGGALTLPRLLELDLRSEGARAPVPGKLSENQIAGGKSFHDQIYARTGTERAAPQRTIRDAMMYHRTGDEGYMELYRYGIMSHIRYYAENEYINEEGLGRYDRDFRDSWTWKLVVTWDLLEEHPTWSEEERLLITNHIVRCVLECNVYQHWMSPERIEEWRTFDSITHNHHTWPGLANLFGGWYFKRHYNHFMADDWLTIALGMFSGCKKSSKPWEDSAGYQWIPMGHILTYSNASGDSTYMEEGHADRTGKVALMCLDSLGHQPAFGDHSSFTGSSRLPTMLSALEYATRDGRYRWALEWLGVRSEGELEEPYYTDIEPVRPDDLTGVTVSYLPKPHFDLNGLNPQYFPKANIPFEQSFDKLTFRAGWQELDDYLFLDGYSGGSHGHQDCNAIIAYTAAGAHWLVDGEYIRQTPKYHCAVTVVRDGISIRNPAMARLEDAVWFGDAAISRTTIPDYNGVRWTRHLFWRPNGWVTAVDRLTAIQPGDYSLRCCWRIYGEAELGDGELRLSQDDARFVMLNLSGDRQELVHVKDVAAYPVHHLYQRRSRRLEAGESVSFVNVFAADAQGLPTLEGRLCADGRVSVTHDSVQTVLGVGSFRHEGQMIEAGAWLADTESVRIASATRYLSDEDVVWEHAEPVGLLVEQSRIREASEETTPDPGQRAAETTAAGSVAAVEGGLDWDVTALARPVSPASHSASAVLSAAPRSAAEWSYGGFPRTPKPIRVSSVSTRPQPHRSYRPQERLINGYYSSSAGSCLFPAGEAVTIDLDLDEAFDISEVRIRAWEMSETWQTRNRAVQVSLDGETWTDLPSEPTVVGTQRWGGNVNTIYGVPVEKRARFVRVTAEPATEECSVYFAEIEVIGQEQGDLPDLTAIMAADLNDDGAVEFVVGTGGGHVVALDNQGTELWRADIGAPITVLATLPGPAPGARKVIYGASQDLLGLLDADGTPLKEVNIPQYRGLASEPQNITVADLDGDGTLSIVVGVRSWQYLAYSPELELEWKNVIYAHSATVAEVADLDGDGQLETVGGNAYYCMNIINSDGTRRLRAGRFGPEQSAVISADLTGDGHREVIFGTDGGDVLVFDLEGNQLWERNVGDRVTSFCTKVVDDEVTVLASSESGFVWAFDGSGRALWSVNLAEPVRRMVSIPGGVVCAASGAGTVTLTVDGKVAGSTATSAAAMDIAVADGACAAILRDGTMCKVPMASLE